MPVITVSRGSFSGGKMLAELLATRLGYRCIGRETIVQHAAANGISEQELLDALLKAPSFLERFRHTRYRYLTLLQAALAEEVQSGDAVYHGNAGHLLLKGGGPVLCARVIAPMEFRTAMAMGQLHCDRSDAIAYIERVDSERRKWTHYLYGMEWDDPALYDAVINLEHVGISQASDVLAVMAKRRCFAMVPECREQLTNMVIASRVKARLALDPATAHIEFEIAAENGAVAIRGRFPALEEQVEVRRVAEATPGVTCVNLEHSTSWAEVN